MNDSNEIMLLQYQLKSIEDKNRIIFKNIEERLYNIDNRIKEIEEQILELI